MVKCFMHNENGTVWQNVITNFVKNIISYQAEPSFLSISFFFFFFFFFVCCFDASFLFVVILCGKADHRPDTEYMTNF